MKNRDILELSKILNKVSEKAVLSLNKTAILELPLSYDKEVVEINLNETNEALKMVYRLSDISYDNFSLDITIDRIRISSLLNITEIIELKKMIKASQKFSEYRNKFVCLDSLDSSLDNYFTAIIDLKDVLYMIDKVVDYDGNIQDSASDNLFKIRREMKRKESEIVSKLNDILKTHSDKLADQVITIRNGHHVIPIKVEYKSSVKGIIYDESSSGQTVFIEPAFVQQLESELMLLRNEEAKEIEKILYDLSNNISGYYEGIRTNYDITVHLDFVFAKAKYAKETESTKPEICNKVELIEARHPLIDPEVIVPNDIILNKRMMIITGPNTGGKTVVLKTLGLLALMVKAGFLIPVKEGSKIILFNDILADIGDEQSIEQSLSTFSSHMERIVNIIDNHEENSLILFDELGSGTDPKEGASLGIAILKYLLEENVYTVVTTHYPELKTFAYSNDNILNASVLFDTESLRPTYKLLIGTSGRSNAFLISSRLGLRNDIIEDAKNLSLEFKDENSDFIQRLENEGIELKKTKEENIVLKESLKDEINHYKELLKGLKNKEKNAMDQIEKEKNKVLLDTQTECNKLLEEIKWLKKNLSDESVKHNVLSDLKGRTNNLISEKEVKSKGKRVLEVGDQVEILSLNTIGEIIEIKNNKYVVLIGSMKSKYEREDLEYVQVEEKKDKLKPVQSDSVINTSVTSRLDLRGKRYEEALQLLDKFINDAICVNLDEVTVIHGFGSLILRNMVIDYCKKHSVIKRFRSGEEHEGGRGITVIYFK